MVSIKSYNCFERVQADLIDYRYMPNGRYTWVLHLKVCELLAYLPPLFPYISKSLSMPMMVWIVVVDKYVAVDTIFFIFF